MLGNLLSKLGILQKLFAQATDFRNTIIDSGTTCNISAWKILRGIKELGDGAHIELTWTNNFSTALWNTQCLSMSQFKLVAAVSPWFYLVYFIYLVEACTDTFRCPQMRPGHLSNVRGGLTLAHNPTRQFGEELRTLASRKIKTQDKFSTRFLAH